MPKKYKYSKYFTFEGKRYCVRADDETELIMRYADKLRDLKEGKVTVSGSMTVRKWAERCLDTYKANVKPETLRDMRSRINKHIICQIGDMQLKAVKPLMCQEIMNAQAGMSKSHIKKLSQELSFIFEKAVENKLILENPVKGVALPQGYRGRRRSITDDERKHLLLVCKKEERFRLFLLMLYCGCRPGEAMEVQGRDIEEIDGIHMLHIRGTKTQNADRYVPIPDDLYPIIKDTASEAPIAPNAAGRRHSESSYKRLAESLRRELNLSMGCRTYRNALLPPLPLAEDFVPYCLRHTYCTDLCKAGVDVRVAQRLMGHASIEMTAEVYTHVDNSQIVEAAGKIREARLAATA